MHSRDARARAGSRRCCLVGGHCHGTCQQGACSHPCKYAHPGCSHPLRRREVLHRRREHRAGSQDCGMATAAWQRPRWAMLVREAATTRRVYGWTKIAYSVGAGCPDAAATAEGRRMGFTRNAGMGYRLSDILSAFLLCLVAVLAGAQAAPNSGLVPPEAASAAKVAGQPSSAIVHKRSFIFVSSAAAKATVVANAGGTDLALPPREIRLPENAASAFRASAWRSRRSKEARHAYDACAPPALI